MKNKQNIIAVLLLFCLSFASCEKGIEQIEMDSKVYLPASGLYEQPVLLGESVFELGIYKSGINQANASVTVQMKVDEAALLAYKATDAKSELLPEKYYHIDSYTVTIAEGKEREVFKVNLRGIDENFINKKYILPLTIENVSPSVEILEEKRTVLVSFNRFRNAWECKYRALGAITPAGAEKSTVAIDEVLETTTASVNSIQFKGPENDMNVLLTVLNGKVQVSAVAGSEKFQIKNTDGKTSTYVGTFDPVCQSYRGEFKLYYTYTMSGQEMNVEETLKFFQ